MTMLKAVITKEDYTKWKAISTKMASARARRWCVHRWRAGHESNPFRDYWYCEKCGWRVGDFFMAPPDFMTFLLPFILLIGVIGGSMVAVSAIQSLPFPIWLPVLAIPILSLVGSIWWIRKRLE
jgi:hypothetical protein